MAVVLLVAALVLVPAVVPLAGETYYARTLWTAKHLSGVDRMWFLLREPWLERPTGAGVRVAIVDTGIDPTHPDLEGAVVGWRDFVHGRARPYDDHGHGTHVAAILAGRGHLQWNPFSSYFLTGARGIAPGAELLVAKAMGADGTGDDVRVAEAIRWAMDPNGDGDLEDGADVINLSLGIVAADGGPVASGACEAAVRAAIDAGIAVVVAAGNDGREGVASPAHLPGVIAVGALDHAGDVAAFSNWGNDLDLLAPGVLVSAVPESLDERDVLADGYTAMGGTSMAAPVVAGVLALMLEAHGGLLGKDPAGGRGSAVAHVESILRSTARPLDDDRGGAGAVDAFGAVRAVDKGTTARDPAFGAAALAALAGVALGARRSRRTRFVVVRAGRAA